MRLLLDKLFFSVGLGHFTVDLLNGQRAVLFTFLMAPLGMGNTALGFFTTIFIISGSLLQPLFGYFTDRYGPRWFAAGGILWIGLFFSLAMIAPGMIALWLLVIASLGSAAFHPAGTMQATLRGRDHYSGKETTAAAYFFVFGQAGLFLGPVLAGVILDRSGTSGLLLLSALAIPVGILVARQLRQVFIKAPHTTARLRRSFTLLRRDNLAKALLPLVAFALLAVFQSWSQQNMVTFVPKHLSDLGQPASAYGLVAALFMGGSALGNILGGSMADRFGKRRVTAMALALASIPLYLVSVVGLSSWLLLLIPLSGGLTGATHSIIVVLAQRMIPTGMAMASGMILGFMFASGAVGTFFSGYLADLYGVPMVFLLSAVIALAAAGLALSLPKT
jgi:FSR family fosmidomycin resistance protein-like MFS transporter